MNYNQIIYQIYPIGLCGAPKPNDGNQLDRIKKVKEFVPHLKKLGVTQVLFNPVFESDNHGYDTREFCKIDCRLGTNQDFKEVCDLLHEAGIGVILDGVFNHVGRGFPYFKDVIEKKWDSPYKDWFHINFDDHNHQDGFWYEGWEGHNELVKLNMRNETVRHYLIDCVDQWIEEFGIDGLRLDVAYMVDRTFMHELCDHVRASHPEFLFIGEMIGGDYNVLMRDNLLDSVTNYECRKGLYSAMNSHNLFEIAHSLNRQFGSDPWSLYRGKHLISFVDNHDVNRIASELSDSKDLPLTYAIMYAMPGIPAIYYGSEWAIRGKRTNWSDDALRPYVEKPEWNSLTDFLKKLNEIRKEYDVFTYGDFANLCIRNEQLAFRRRSDKGQLTFVVNISDQPLHFGFDAQVEGGIDLITGKTVRFNNGVDLAAKETMMIYTDFTGNMKIEAPVKEEPVVIEEIREAEIVEVPEEIKEEIREEVIIEEDVQEEEIEEIIIEEETVVKESVDNLVLRVEHKKSEKDEKEMHAFLKTEVPLQVYFEDETHTVKAGAIAVTSGNWLILKEVYIDEAYDERSACRAMLDALETEAIRRDCKFALIDSTDTFAEKVYPACGYKQGLVLNDYPFSGSRRFFTKEL